MSSIELSHRKPKSVSSEAADQKSTTGKQDATADVGKNKFAAGNLAIQDMLHSGAIQADLKIGSLNDPAEKEADNMANAAVSGSMVDSRLHAANLGIQRKCPACEQEENEALIQRKSDTSASASAPANGRAQTGINNLTTGGTALPPEEQGFFQPRFGRNFDEVRIHTGTDAASASKSINAKAFTHGNHIAFADGEYAPGTKRGRKLLAHELAHVAQQQQSGDRMVRRSPEDGQSYTVALPFSAGEISLAGGEIVEVVDWREGQDNAQVQLPAPHVNAYESFDIPKLFLQYGEGVVQQGEYSGPTIIASFPVEFEGELLDMGEASGADLSGGPINLGALADLSSTPAGESSAPPLIGSTLLSAGLSTNPLAMGEHSFLGGGNVRMTRPQIMRYMLSSDYWGPMVPRGGDITLDRVGTTFPRNLQPRSLFEPNWSSIHGERMPFTSQELDSIEGLVRRYGQNPASLAPEELALLRRAAGTHISGGAPGSPFASYMTPGHMVGWQPRYRVRVQMPTGSILDVSVPNAFNQMGALPNVTNVAEAEFLVTANNRGRIISVQRNTGNPPPGFAMRHANKIRWGGRIIAVAGVAYSGHRITTAEEQDRPRVIGEELGSMALGAAGTSLAIAGCVALGVATGGVALFVCGLAGGIVGGTLGTYAGGEVGEAVGPSPIQDAANFVVSEAVSAAMNSGSDRARDDAIAVRNWWFGGDVWSELYLLQRFKHALMGR